MLTEKRKADREEMAARIIKLAHECGALAEYSDPLGPREIRIEIEAPGGLCLGVDFDGGSTQPDTYVLSWHMGAGEGLRIKLGSFGPGSVNEYHQRKATQIARGFDELRIVLANSLKRCASGEIYERDTAEPLSAENLNRAMQARKLGRDTHRAIRAKIEAGETLTLQDASLIKNAARLEHAGALHTRPETWDWWECEEFLKKIGKLPATDDATADA